MTRPARPGAGRRAGWSAAVTVVLAGAVVAWLVLADFGKVHHYQGDAPPRQASLARPPQMALVLGGGGPRGIAHVGVLKVLAQEGIRPDLVVGSSMGALVGVLHAAAPDAAALERLAMDPALAWSWRDLTLATRPWLRGDQLEAMLRARLAGRTLESLPIAAMVVATDAARGEPVAFTAGDIATAVRASTAVPGTFKRVGIAGVEYFDGDVAAPVPVGFARASGARVVIAVDVMSHPADMPADLRDHPGLVLSDYFRHAINLRELPQADLVIAPRLGFYAGFSLEERRRIVAEGERAAREALPRIRSLLGRTPR